MKILLFLFLSLPSFGMAANSKNDKKILSDAYVLFRKGAYDAAIEKSLTIHTSDPKMQATIAFFVASNYSKSQAFDKAIPYYSKALLLNPNIENIHYDFGQAYFAVQNLAEAESHFKKSVERNFKIGASLYYIGFIRGLLDDLVGAEENYNRILALPNDSEKIKQSALYQIADLEYEKAKSLQGKEAQAKTLQVKILPLFEKAKNFELGNPTSVQAGQKIKTIEGEISEFFQTMQNGIPLPRQPFALTISQTMGYDSNVTTQPDDALVEVSNKDSYISTTNLLGKYQFNFRRVVSVIPEVSAAYTYHLRRSTPKVYQNDNLVLGPALRTKFEHFSRGNPATFLVDLEFNYMLRDYLAAHQLPFYSRYWNLSAGERLKWFATGSTTVKMSLKLFESYNPSRNSYSPQFSLQQNIKIFKKWDLSNTFTADYLHARDDSNDERNFKLRHSVTFSRLIEKIDVIPSFSVSVKDTLMQKAARGNETMLNPSLAINRELSERVDCGFEYAYTKNYSLAEQTYKYTKHEVKFSLNGSL